MRVLLHTGLIFAVLSVTQAQNRDPLPDPHKHVVAVHEKPWETDLASDVRMIPLEGPITEVRDSVFSPDAQWLAFVFSAPGEWARVGFLEVRGAKRYQLINVPLPYRAVNDIVWIDSTYVVFDRWSQPHHGMHYVVDIRNARLVLAVPFPDEIFLRQQQDTIR